MNDSVEIVLVDAVGKAIAGSVISGSLVVLGQTIYYLFSGIWVAIPVLQLLVWIDRCLQAWGMQWMWLYNPQSWVGLHRILEVLPLSGSLLIFGLLAMFVAMAILNVAGDS